MSDLICRKTMMRCQHPGMCYPHGGCQPDCELAAANQTIAVLEAQVKALQADPNSWQSGYDEGRRMGDKTARDERKSLLKEAQRYRLLRSARTRLVIVQIGPPGTEWEGCAVLSDDDADAAIDAMLREAEL